jgi:hypothetical protein
MSRVDVRDGRPFVSPLRARSLLTVREAISFARFVEAPRSLALSLMCSGGARMQAFYAYSSGGFWTLCSVA